MPPKSPPADNRRVTRTYSLSPADLARIKDLEIWLGQAGSPIPASRVLSEAIGVIHTSEAAKRASMGSPPTTGER